MCEGGAKAIHIISVDYPLNVCLQHEYHHHPQPATAVDVAHIARALIENTFADVRGSGFCRLNYGGMLDDAPVFVHKFHRCFCVVILVVVVVGSMELGYI